MTGRLDWQVRSPLGRVRELAAVNRAAFARWAVAFCVTACLVQTAAAQDYSTLEGKWRVKLFAPNKTILQEQWNIVPKGDDFEHRDRGFVFAFIKRAGEDGKFDFTISIPGLGKINEGRCTLTKSGTLFEGECSDSNGMCKLWTATRDGAPTSLPDGLYIEAGQATVKRGQKVSIPLFLRYNGPGHAPAVSNMNFDVTYVANVAAVRPHPNPARQATAGANEQPELPKGNLLGGGSLIAGNTQQSGTVRVGFASKNGVKPGMGKPGETLTEIYFEAVGMPGDETELMLCVTTANDPSGKSLEVGLVPGMIRIIGDAPLPPVVIPPVVTLPPVVPPGPGGVRPPPTIPRPPIPPPTSPRPPKRKTALDAYIALLMSVERRPSDKEYDVDNDKSVTSRDSTKILQEAAAAAGEGR